MLADRFGWAVRFIGDLDGVMVEHTENIGGAVAWPSNAIVGPFSGTPCPGVSAGNELERGRAYLFTKAGGQ